MNPELVNVFLKHSKLDNILEADPNSFTEFAMEHRSYDPTEFSSLIDDNPLWSCVIVAHIHIDHVLDTFLNEFCIRPEVINPQKHRLTVLDKSVFLHSVGVLSKGSLTAIKKLNSIRNKFAHKLHFEVSHKEQIGYRSVFTSSYQSRLTERPEFKEAERNEIDLKTLLKLSVVFVEEERLASLIGSLRRAQSELDLKDAMAVAQRTLSGSAP